MGTFRNTSIPCKQETSINTTSIITVELFVTTAWLAVT